MCDVKELSVKLAGRFLNALVVSGCFFVSADVSWPCFWPKFTLSSLMPWVHHLLSYFKLTALFFYFRATLDKDFIEFGVA